ARRLHPRPGLPGRRPGRGAPAGRPVPVARGRRHHRPGRRGARRPVRPGPGRRARRRGPVSPADPGAAARAVAALGDRARPRAGLGALTTYRRGGRAAVLVEADGADDLRAVAVAVAASGLPTLVIGKGSNLLVA